MADKRIVIIGAGSRSFGRGMVVDLLSREELSGRGLSMWLVDLNAEALEEMKGFAELVAAKLGSDISIHAATDRTEALLGAAYVLVAVEVRRMELWEQDFRVPLSHGFRNVLGENGGPGALFHALRTLDLVVPICRDVEKLAPDAWLLNYTNPEGRVLDAILHLTKVKAAGLCHGVFSVIGFISKYLDRPTESIEVTSAGLNHFYFVQKVIDKETGDDLLPGLLERVKADPELEGTLWRKFIDIFGWLTYKSDDHIGEYVSYGAEFRGVKWPYGLESHSVSRPKRKGFDPAEYVAKGQIADDDWVLKPSAEIGAPIISDMETGESHRYDAVNVLNSGPYIPNLPQTAVIEIPATCDSGGLHPVTVDPIPEGPAALMRTQLSIQRLLTEAYRTRDRSLLLQALCIDPVVNSVTEAEKLLDEMLELQKDFLPEFE